MQETIGDGFYLLGCDFGKRPAVENGAVVLGAFMAALARVAAQQLLQGLRAWHSMCP